MKATTEARWWFAGTSPEEVDGWFSALPGVEEPTSRVDRYLRAVDPDDAGVKTRADMLLEVKALVGRDREVALADGVTGDVERWRKWSFDLAGAPPGPEEAADERFWLAVAKRRFTVRRGRCALELAEETHADEVAWSLGAEALGVDDAAEQALRGALTWLVGSGPPAQLELTTAHAAAFPSHLLRSRAP